MKQHIIKRVQDKLKSVLYNLSLTLSCFALTVLQVALILTGCIEVLNYRDRGAKLFETRCADHPMPKIGLIGHFGMEVALLMETIIGTLPCWLNRTVYERAWAVGRTQL